MKNCLHVHLFTSSQNLPLIPKKRNFSQMKKNSQKNFSLHPFGSRNGDYSMSCLANNSWRLLGCLSIHYSTAVIQRQVANNASVLSLRRSRSASVFVSAFHCFLVFIFILSCICYTNSTTRTSTIKKLFVFTFISRFELLSRHTDFHTHTHFHIRCV